MKLIGLLLTINLMQITASVYSQNGSFRVENTKLTLQEAILAIESQTDYRIAYSATFVNQQTQIKLSKEEITVESFLEDIAKKLGIGYFLLENDVIVLTNKKGNLLEQEIVIKGKITDVEGTPLPGVNVVEKGTSNGAVTNLDGEYTISVSSPKAMLSFSYVGFLTEEIEIAGNTTIDIVLIEDILSLDEVVVIGYGSLKKSDLTGSVASVRSDDIENEPIQHMANVLQGRASGVNVTNISGIPNGNIRIRIRGINSINGGNEPLYVVDGVTGYNLFSNLDPTDIQSIEVLKDASSTAIYGSRGANGVILVTTKRGSEGKMKLEFETQQSLGTIPKKLDLLDAVEYANFYNEYQTHYGAPEEFSQDEINKFKSGEAGTDWQDLMFQTAYTQNYKLAASGGTTNFNYRFSGNIRDAEGILVASNYKKYNIRSNMQIKTTDWLQIGLELNGAMTESQGNRGYLGDVVSQAVTYSPTLNLRDENGNWLHDNISSWLRNPYGRRVQNKDDVLSKYFGGNTRFTFDLPIEGLTFEVLGAANYYSTKEYGLTSSEYDLNTSNGASNNHREGFYWQNTNQLTYNRSWGVHDLTAMAVAEYTRDASDILELGVNSLVTESLSYWKLGLGSVSNYNNNYSEWSLASYVGRIMYHAMDKYLLTATLRRDGSSKFQGDNKWGYFPSVALAWRASSEPFISDMDIFDILKFRVSYGITGNQAISPYSTLGNLAYSAHGWGTNTPYPGYWAQDIATPDLTWEKTYQMDAGIDMGFFDNRIFASFDYYVKNTKDLLLDKAIPYYDGGGSMKQNLGHVKNTGFEVSLDAVPVKTGDISWESTVNFAYQENEVISMGGDSILHPGNSNNLVQFNPFVLKVGEPMGSIWGYTWLGIFGTDEVEEAGVFDDKPGDNKFLNFNNDSTINSADQGIIGKAFPDFIFGWNNTFTWKNWELNVFLQGAIGGEQLNLTRYMISEAISDAKFVTSKEGYYNLWTPDNQDTNIPNIYSTTNNTQAGSTQYLESTDYLRVKNLSISYALPVKTIKGITNFKLSLNAQNLYTFTKFKGWDPEIMGDGTTDTRAGFNGGYPVPRTFTLGLRASF